jgi:simple sugar transport system permease protein
LLADLLQTGVPLSIPLLLASLGEIFVERAGVINVGIEGMVLAGALAGFAGSCVVHNAAAGAACAAGAGIALAALLAFVSIHLRADQVVVGAAINILSLGLTGVFWRTLSQGAPVVAVPFRPWPIPLLHRLPVIGQALFTQNSLGYLAWLLVPCCWLYLYRTRPGLRLRAAGEYPRAADGAGVRVNRVRTLAVLWGGALAGLAGAFLSIGYTDGFVENMSAGRGFIALAVVILGRWNPIGALAAALLFGMASALQFQFQASTDKFPYQFFLALPYLLTLLALLFRSRLQTAPPAALGEPYERG